ncbi:MAG: L-lactate permease [Anaerolineae bacterium]
MTTPPVNLLNWLLAFSPIAVILVLMIGLRWGARRAGPAGWIVALVVAWLRFGAGSRVLFYSQGRGVLLSLFVLYIIWMALLLYRVVDEAGALAAVGRGIARLTGDRTMQLLLIAWAFSAFIQGVAGFGVGIAVVTPLLVGLGIEPLIALAAVSIGHSWAVTFGSMGSSFQALMAASGLSGYELAPWSATMLGVACFGCGFFAAWVDRGWQSVRRGWPALLIVGTVMAGVQILLAVSGLWNLGGFGAGLAGLGAAALVARLPRYRSRQAPAGEGEPTSDGAMASAGTGRRPVPLWLALAPYLVLVAVVALAELWPWLNDVLNRVQIAIDFPRVETSYGWVTPAGTGRTISVFGHAGALLAYVAVLFYAVYRLSGYYTPGTTRRILRQTGKSGLSSTIGIATMVGMALAMDNSGMTYVLAQGLSQIAGPVYPLVSAFIGLLGAFTTGSNTNSNVVFAPLQQQAAGLLNLNLLVILAAQTTGGSLGSMIAPAKLIVGAGGVGLVGREGEVLKKTLLPGLILTAVTGLLAWLFS